MSRTVGAARRFDRGTLRSVGFVALLTVVFLVTNTAVAAAADGSGGEGGGLLAPLNVYTVEGVPLEAYELESDGGMRINIVGQTQALVLSGLFTLVRLLAGLACWLIGFVFRFPLLTLLTEPAQNLSDAYATHVVGPLGLKELLLAWAFVFGLIAFMRGRAAAGLGEIVLTLVIAALAASVFVRPDYLLGRDGPLQQVHQAAVEVAQITTHSYFDQGPEEDPCAELSVGPAKDACRESGHGVVRPIQDAVTDALVVKPFMLVQYGRILDPKDPDEKAAYEAHMAYLAASLPRYGDGDGGGTDPCSLIKNKAAREYCERGDATRRPSDPPEATVPGVVPTPQDLVGQVPLSPQFDKLLKNLDAAGPVGKEAAAYAKAPSWDRVGAVLALLVAVVVVALMVVSMAMVMLGAQAADAAAAAGGATAMVWAMLPGPSRTVLWKWLSVFMVSMLVSFVAAMMLPLFGITVDVLLASASGSTMVERLLLLDAVAVAFLALHRRMIAAVSSFGQRMATRARFMKVGGTHMPGDTSPLGAALAVHGPGGGSRGLMGLGGRGRFGSLLAGASAGMPFTPTRLLQDAAAEGGRGLAPFAMAAKAGHTALIGPRPNRHTPLLAQLQAAAGQPQAVQQGSRGEKVVDPWTSYILHDPATDRPLLGSRIHQRASRLRGYRIAHRAGSAAYALTFGLPRTWNTAGTKASQYAEDAMTQLKVSSLNFREDWRPVGQTARAAVRGLSESFADDGQRLATAWQVYDPPGRVRDAAVAAAVYAGSRSTSGSARPPASVRPASSVTAPRVPSSADLASSAPAGPHPSGIGRPASATTSGSDATGPIRPVTIDRPVRGAGRHPMGSAQPAPRPAAGQAGTDGLAPVRPSGAAGAEQAQAAANRNRLLQALQARQRAAADQQRSHEGDAQ
ncbi:hypothetical protein [Streptomyces sp. NPDC089799]|uniref:hypothetical protein n=1 Tax=Streptomyces sp. NPDC089799 TaxID=3155066 RepID=UPI00341686A7